MGHFRGVGARPGQQHPILEARSRPGEGRQTATLATPCSRVILVCSGARLTSIRETWVSLLKEVRSEHKFRLVRSLSPIARVSCGFSQAWAFCYLDKCNSCAIPSSSVLDPSRLCALREPWRSRRGTRGGSSTPSEVPCQGPEPQDEEPIDATMSQCGRCGVGQSASRMACALVSTRRAPILTRNASLEVALFSQDDVGGGTPGGFARWATAPATRDRCGGASGWPGSQPARPASPRECLSSPRSQQNAQLQNAPARVRRHSPRWRVGLVSCVRNPSVML